MRKNKKLSPVRQNTRRAMSNIFQQRWRAASPSPPSSLTHVHRCIGSRKSTRQTLPTSAKLKYLSVYDRRDGVSERASSPSPPSSLTYVHRCIGSRNTTRQTLPTSPKLTSLSMCDSRNGATQCM
jgi:hypothetical protein